MPHPEQQHSLMIEVARLRKEADDAHTRERSLRTDLAAARRALDRIATAKITDFGHHDFAQAWSMAQNVARTALAAPAAAAAPGEDGEDKRRGGKPEISMQDVLDNMIDDLSKP